tara:strand:- start:1808 stop:2011 length:204 start_codon:yes stop_codon:yes gene_type:complete
MVLQLKSQLKEKNGFGHMKIADKLIFTFSKNYGLDLSQLSLEKIHEILNDNDWIRLAYAIKYGNELH